MPQDNGSNSCCQTPSYRASNSFLPHSGDDVMISEGEDDRSVVIQGDEEGRHL